MYICIYIYIYIFEASIWVTQGVLQQLPKKASFIMGYHQEKNGFHGLTSQKQGHNTHCCFTKSSLINHPVVLIKSYKHQKLYIDIITSITQLQSCAYEIPGSSLAPHLLGNMDTHRSELLPPNP